MSTTVIYHPDYLDSIVGCWIMSLLGADLSFVKGDYDKLPIAIDENSRVILIGFSYNSEVIRELASLVPSVTIILHHQTTVSELTNSVCLPNNVSIKTKPGFSTAVLVWQEYFPNSEIPRYVQLIQDRTLWKFENDQTNDYFMGLMGRGVMTLDLQRVFTLFNAMKTEEENWRTLAETTFSTLCREGRILNLFKMQEINKLIKEGQRYITFLGFKVPVLNAPKFLVSEAGNIMSKGELFSVCYYDTEKGRNFHLRSRPQFEGGMDVSKFAVEFGGGGNQTAATFKVDRSHPLAGVL